MGLGPLLVGDQPLPHSKDMERAMLSCFLQDPKRFQDEITDLSPEIFYIPSHRRVFHDLQSVIHQEMVDICVLSAFSERNDPSGESDITSHLLELYSAIPTTVNYQSYADCVLEMHERRKMIEKCSQLLGDSYDTSTSHSDNVQEWQKAANGVDQIGTNSSRSMKELLDMAIENIEKVYRHDKSVIGLATGFRNLDKIIRGLLPGKYYVIAARQSIGKTTLALNIAQNIAGFGHPVMYVTREMKDIQLVERVLCAAANVDMQREVYENRDTLENIKSRLQNVSSKMVNLPLEIDDKGGSWEDHRQRIRSSIKKNNLKCVIIDYMQQLKLRDKKPLGIFSREEEVAYISQDIQNMALESGVPFVVLAQLNRKAESDSDKPVRPKPSHLRESGALEQDADVVALIDRKRRMEDAETKEKMDNNQPIPADLGICKNRQGPTGRAELEFWAHLSRFTDRTGITDEDVPV